MLVSRKKLIGWIPSLIWMGIIFMFSSQPASQSNDLSTGFTKFVFEMLGKVLPFNVEISTINDFAVRFNHIARKSAHFCIYLILGLLVSGALTKNKYKGKLMLVSLIICALYAAGDEFHQSFVPGRGCQLKDVFIDSAGAYTGILFNKVLRSVIKST
ncbi:MULTISPECIES: VanZ family protein [unclassified Sedimentibacter]|uniref:VanZ family protein n=1 Tax=unclassified Sedimentibacter TaxID=2649220 RepID=UPI0027E13BF8|nr:VanZ family protein [Sedimentibacter sp. MB35-C1]WMJ76762.1 VanZ family protein [Sedimentibacter sp. MB35-C1]